MSKAIELEIAALYRMTTSELAERFEELHGHPTHTRHRDYLIRKVAWRMQANAEGDLSERLHRIRTRAAELANDAEVRVMAPKTLICPPQPAAPASVTRALAAFLDECCVVEEYARVGKNELYAVYEAWCRDSGEFAVSKKKLGQQLIERGFAEGRSRTGRYWIGIGVIDEGASYGQG